MRLLTALTLLTLFLFASGCATSREVSLEEAEKPASAPAANTQVAQQAANANSSEGAKLEKVSLTQADQAQAAAQAVERKIIKNAELTIEVAKPSDEQDKVAAIAAAHGGYVVTSETQQNSSTSQPSEVVNITMRVPAAQFDAVVSDLRAIGVRVPVKKITGQDVTEEYIDLEARLRTQRALEAQYLEIMKQANKVSDALEVNRQLAEVRGGIEQLEGRRRFLENQAALSTIKVTLQTPAPLVSTNTTGFLYSIKQAFGDGIDVAAGIILVLIRIVIALIPVFLFIVLPVVLLWRILRRRFRRAAPSVVAPQPEPR